MTNTNLISKYRDAVQAMLKTFADCRALEGVMTSQGGAASLIKPEDFEGANADLDPASFTAIVDSRTTLETYTGQNFLYTNLNKALN